MAGVLAKYVEEFVDDVSADLHDLSSRDHRADVTIEAGELIAAVIDSDERLTAAELEAWLDDIGPRLDPPVLVSSTRLREGGMLEGKRRWLEHPSTLFDLLLRADASKGGRRAVRYYEAGIRLAHAAAAVDLVPSPDEIAAIDRFRNMLLGAFDEAGVARPGTPEAGSGSRTATGAAGPEAVAKSPSHHLPDRWRSCWPSSMPWSGSSTSRPTCGA